MLACKIYFYKKKVIYKFLEYIQLAIFFLIIFCQNKIIYYPVIIHIDICDIN